MRPLLAVTLAAPFGVVLAQGDLFSRVTINVVSALVMLPLIAVAVDILREHGEVQRRLIAARSAVEERRADADRGVEELRHQFAATVAERLDAAIGATGGELGAVDAAALLRRISDDVVRPMSHELFRDAQAVDADVESRGTPADRGEGELDLGRPIRVRDRLRRIASGLQPDPPIVIALVYLVLVFPHFLTTYGLAVTIIQTPVIGGIYLAGNAATFAIGSRIPSAVWRITAIVACYTGVALVAALQNGAALALFGYSAEFYWAEVASYPFIAVTIAIIRSVSVQLHGDEDALAASLRERVRLATGAQSRLKDVRLRLSHVLHSTVQAELIAVSLGLGGHRPLTDDRMPATEGDARPVDASAVVAGTVADIKRALLSPTVGRTPSARDGIEAILAMWGTALRIGVDIDDEVWDLLDSDPARASAVIDALSEGLTNAVRHGRGVTAALSIRHDPGEDQVIVELRSEGTIAQPRHGDAGIGLAALRRIGSRVSIRAEDEHVVLTVVVS